MNMKRKKITLKISLKVITDRKLNFFSAVIFTILICFVFLCCKQTQQHDRKKKEKKLYKQTKLKLSHEKKDIEIKIDN